MHFSISTCTNIITCHDNAHASSGSVYLAIDLKYWKIKLNGPTLGSQILLLYVGFNFQIKIPVVTCLFEGSVWSGWHYNNIFKLKFQYTFFWYLCLFSRSIWLFTCLPLWWAWMCPNPHSKVSTTATSWDWSAGIVLQSFNFFLVLTIVSIVLFFYLYVSHSSECVQWSHWLGATGYILSCAFCCIFLVLSVVSRAFCW